MNIEKKIAKQILIAVNTNEDQIILKSFKRTKKEDTYHSYNKSVHSVWSYLTKGYRQVKGNPRYEFLVSHLEYDIMTKKIDSEELLERLIEYCTYDGGNICENSVRMLSDILKASSNECIEFELWLKLQ